MRNHIPCLILLITLLIAEPSTRSFAALPIASESVTTVDQYHPAASTSQALQSQTQSRSRHSTKVYNSSGRSADGTVYGILSLTCAIIGIFFAGIPMGIAAVILGIIGLNKTMKGLSIAGIIIGAIDIVLVSLFLAANGI